MIGLADGLHLTGVLGLLLVGHVSATRKMLGPNNRALFPGRQFQRVVLNILSGPAENGMQQLLLRGKLCLGLRRYLANQNVARMNHSTNANNAVLVQISQGLLGDIGDVPGEFLTTQLGLADLDLKIVNVNAGKTLFLNQGLGDDNGVLKVVAVKGHKGHQDVLAQGQLTINRGGTVGNDLALLDPLTLFNTRLLIQTGTLIQADKLAQLILIAIVHDDMLGIDILGPASLGGPNNHTGVLGHSTLDTSGHNGNLTLQQRHGLTLHVRTHQGPVGVIMLQERYQCG